MTRTICSLEPKTFLIIFVQFLQILYFKRSFFLINYDVSYWKDRLEHSQWTLPLSKRIIGDDGLFSYGGYTLAIGASPDGLNTETAPLGRYLIEFSILLFKSPAYYLRGFYQDIVLRPFEFWDRGV